MSTCSGTLLLHDNGVYYNLFCTEPAWHQGDHFDQVFSYRWRDGALIGTCHLPPVSGIEVME